MNWTDRVSVAYDETRPLDSTKEQSFGMRGSLSRSDPIPVGNA